MIGDDGNRSSVVIDELSRSKNTRRFLDLVDVPFFGNARSHFAVRVTTRVTY